MIINARSMVLATIIARDRESKHEALGERYNKV